jgi:hypothetical protein
LRVYIKHHLQWFIFIGILLLIIPNGCIPNIFNNTRGFIWLDDPIITSGLDADGEPVDEIEVFTSPVNRVHCFLRIRGPDQVQLGVRWYYQDDLIWTDTMNFGQKRKASVFLARDGDKPFPPGDYRCEIYAVEDTLRIAHFRIE